MAACATRTLLQGWTNGRRGFSSRACISASWWTSLSARLAPGEQLDENALARRYGGGLAGIREALARLALEGLVVRRARVGTSVAPLDLAGAREAFEARCLIEVHCAGLAALHASEAEIAAIRATLDDGETAVQDNDQAALAAMDEAFHVAVAAASGNRTLAKMVVSLHHQTARYWLYAMRGPDRQRRHGGAERTSRAWPTPSPAAMSNARAPRC